MSLSKKEKINFWVKSAKEELANANALFKTKRYVGCLFFGHLAVEKILKALVEKTDKNPPYTHDLKILAKLSGIPLEESQVRLITEINTFNLKTRYEDFKFEFYKKATRKYTEHYLGEIEGIYQWFLKQI